MLGAQCFIKSSQLILNDFIPNRSPPRNSRGCNTGPGNSPQGPSPTGFQSDTGQEWRNGWPRTVDARHQHDWRRKNHNLWRSLRTCYLIGSTVILHGVISSRWIEHRWQMLDGSASPRQLSRSASGPIEANVHFRLSGDLRRRPRFHPVGGPVMHALDSRTQRT